MNVHPLFCRYGGGDPKPETDKSAAKSSHLQRLLAKIEENKQKLEDKKRRQEVLINRLVKTKKKKEEEKLEKEQEQSKSSSKKVKKRKRDQTEQEVQDNNAQNGGEEKDIAGQFTVLGDNFSKQKKTKVAAVLPYWMKNPSIISGFLKNLTVTVHDLPQLDKDIVKKLEKNGITHFFPVQHEVIPWLLESQSKPPQFWARDVCVCMPTGSGKTLAFVLPIVQALRNRFIPHIRALVVVPIKELATQVHKVFLDYIDITDLRVVCLSGAESFENEQSQLVRYSEVDKKFCSCADIVVTTAGRLVDHLQATPGFSLHHLKYLVIDEADRVIERMHNDWLYHLERHLISVDMRKVPPLTVREMAYRQPPPQKLLFSATLTSDPEKLQTLGLFRPTYFAYESKNSENATDESSGVKNLTTPDELSEYWVACDIAMKPLYLYHLIKEGDWKTVLVFVNSLEKVHSLAILLRFMFQGHKNKSVSELSSISKHRDRCFNSFVSGHSNILVTTDALGRGFDLAHLECVISYDCPLAPRVYLHRAGRAGRAGREGIAITLVETTSMKQFHKVFQKTGFLDKMKEKTIDDSVLESSQDNYQKALEFMKNKLQFDHKKISETIRRDKFKVRGGKLKGGKKSTTVGRMRQKKIKTKSL